MLRFVEDLAGVGAVEGQPRMEGKATHVIISPVKAATGGGTPAKEKSDKPEKPKEVPAGAATMPPAAHHS